MSYTAFCDPLHVIPQEIDMPAMKDGLGQGEINARRQLIRSLSSWQLEMPGSQEKLESILGLLEYVQGDEAIWFDGAGFGEVADPILIWIGDGGTTDIRLPHRYVYVSTLVIYLNGTVFTDWIPLGGDGVVTCDSIRTGTAAASDYWITAKYRRKIKCLVKVEDKITRARQFRDPSFVANNIHRLTVSLDEVAI